VQLSRSDDYDGGELQFDDIVRKPGDNDNDGGGGGECRIEADGKEVYIGSKRQGSVIAFPSFLRHRVSIVTRGVRKSLVAWFCGTPYYPVSGRFKHARLCQSSCLALCYQISYFSFIHSDPYKFGCPWQSPSTTSTSSRTYNDKENKLFISSDPVEAQHFLTAIGANPALQSGDDAAAGTDDPRVQEI
jgi:hypothetical protein